MKKKLFLLLIPVGVFILELVFNEYVIELSIHNYFLKSCIGIIYVELTIIALVFILVIKKIVESKE